MKYVIYYYVDWAVIRPVRINMCISLNIQVESLIVVPYICSFITLLQCLCLYSEVISYELPHTDAVVEKN